VSHQSSETPILEQDVKGTPKRERRFLMSAFPPGLERNSPHLQLTDNYLTNTRLRLRKIRVPETKERRWLLTQIIHPVPADLSQTIKVNTWLSAQEYEVLSVFEGNETRKNRFAYRHEGRGYTIDLYLGPLWGLLIAKTTLESDPALAPAPMPDFASADITNDLLFNGPKLSELTIQELRSQFSRTNI
jgi:CYTH domain-containing protein